MTRSGDGVKYARGATIKTSVPSGRRWVNVFEVPVDIFKHYVATHRSRWSEAESFVYLAAGAVRKTYSYYEGWGT